MPQVIHRQVSDLREMLSASTVSVILLVVDEAAYQHSGAQEALEPLLSTVTVHHWSQFTPNPTLAELENGVAKYQACTPDVVIAIGGGTALDLGKLISFYGKQTIPCRELILSPATNTLDPTPLVAIATTSGTGSETTQFAVIYVDGEKHSVADPRIRPPQIVLDPTLTATMPAALTANTGLDALCQGIESMWSVQSTVESREYAQQAISLAWNHLPSAVHQPTPQSRQGMSQAAFHSGQAINISKTTAPHAISYGITSSYAVPHGRAVALTIAAFFQAILDRLTTHCIDPRGSEHVHNVLTNIANQLGCDSPNAAPAKIRQFIESLDCPTKLSQVGVTESEQLEALINKINLERLANFPVQLDSATIHEYLMP
ncbi:MAG: phosphonoacetaldehyde reductase [Planctomycetaceae bacterium]|nr:phosphonoacetaldehyde reductase [Planctomycetaceae bacterium]MBT5123731.1 phosphonoacetaldehyde reductase [Planctomycetaceae bacterium]MBT5598251.1 phosphonoacetaldehyde reductase [Planctomycetaceae bacterium]MBT5884654.1 phosphonoacetaldehyde reductase [Planctomycetaceae bacterium]MBT6846365.1 phosphonoacetaldehyde reductase [Planctomycetaceae bacterium]